MYWNSLHIKCAMKESNQMWSIRFHDKMYKSGQGGSKTIALLLTLDGDDQVLEIRRLMTRTIQLYVCLLETKLPCLAFPECRVDLLVPQDEFLSPPLNLAMSQDSLLQRNSSLNLPPKPDHFMRHSLCLSMSHSSNSIDPPSSSLDLAISRSPLELPPLLCANRQMMGSNVFDFLLDDANRDHMSSSD
ncbi:hypothetical protein GCK32_003363 [Trichostrongylus colubriformis]|uniref:Uncharacterized protein n=1 Tax=Trichostrongylus colubriformis TaxID=6319 RepID=A0AAN8F7F2_TRICO